jgi:hypothetical protein
MQESLDHRPGCFRWTPGDVSPRERRKDYRLFAA